MDLVLNDLQKLICHKPKQPANQPGHTFLRLWGVSYSQCILNYTDRLDGVFVGQGIKV